MTDPAETTGVMLGELKGQMRELIHNVNNLSAKMDALTREVVSAAGLPAKVKEIEERVTLLETDKNKRDGAMGFGGWLLRSPAVGWLVGAAFYAWAVLTGKGHA